MTPELSTHARGQVDAILELIATDVEGAEIRAALAETLSGHHANDNGNGDGTPAPARRLDPGALLDAPLDPIPYRVDQLAADGFVTVLAGHGGEGKSWLALALSIGVACGVNVAGIPCRKGTALYIDGENGERLIARRYRSAAGPRQGVVMFEAETVDLANAQHAAWLAALIRQESAQLVVLDSLRSLAPHLEENNGDTVAPVMHHLRRIARTTGAALIVLHHRPKNTGAAYRGSSVLRDQADVLAVLERVTSDPEGKTRRYLHADGSRGGKFRIDAEPADRWLYLRAHGAHVTLDAAEPYETSTRADAPPSAREQLADQIAHTLHEAGGPMRQAEIARALDRNDDDQTMRRALAELHASGVIRRDGNRGPWIHSDANQTTLPPTVRPHDRTPDTTPHREPGATVCHPPVRGRDSDSPATPTGPANALTADTTEDTP